MKSKALILANVGYSHNDGGKTVPSCLLKIFNKMTVLERQVSLLNVNGFSKEDISILCGNGGIWTKEIVETIVKIGTNVIIAEKNDQLNGRLFDNPFFSGIDELLIIEGNIVFEMGMLSKLRRYHEKDVMVVNGLLNPDEDNKTISVIDEYVSEINDVVGTEYPWVGYSGIMKLSGRTIESLNDRLDQSKGVLDLIKESLDNVKLKTIRYDDLIYGKLNGGYSEELIGGSYSRLNYRLVVKKDSSGEGRSKLINEINWLLSIPAELKPYFSEVLEYDIDSSEVYYNVPYYGSRNLRERIFDGQFDSEKACSFIEKLLDWMFDKVYCRKISDTPTDWVVEKHINRVLDRLSDCKEKCEELGKVIDAEKIVFNDIEYRNVKDIYTELLSNNDFLEKVKPKQLVMIHGDLHFQNILITNETDTGFILVDPRGEMNGSDVYYDLGKIWHSFHAKYDFYHTDQFELDLKWTDGTPVANSKIINDYIEKVYDEIHQRMKSVITKYPFINEDPDWEMKLLFAEASHLCSVSTFHIGKTKTPDRAIVLYLTGVRLINEFYDRYIVNQNRF